MGRVVNIKYQLRRAISVGLKAIALTRQIKCVIVWSIYLHDDENVGTYGDFFPDYLFSYLVSDIDYCINVTCKNGGSCVDGLDKYTCSCGAGFSGDHCETGKYRGNQNNIG